MGLDICGKKSELRYHYSYSGLHFVRWLALLVLGAPKKFGKDESDYTTFHWISHGCISIMREFEKPTVEQLRDWQWAVQRSGYYFPNLMFHSDAEGSYTPRGKVLGEKDEYLLKGNSKKLLEELKLINEHIDDEIKNANPRGCEVFKTLFELVKDEVENGDAVINFY